MVHFHYSFILYREQPRKWFLSISGGTASQDLQAVRISGRGILEKAEANKQLQTSPTVQTWFPRRFQGFSFFFLRSLDLPPRSRSFLPRNRRHRSRQRGNIFLPSFLPSFILNHFYFFGCSSSLPVRCRAIFPVYRLYT